MSNKLTGFLITLLFFALSFFTISLILSIPLYYSFLQLSFYDTFLPLLSIILFVIAGFIFGRFMPSKTFFYALIIIIPYLLIYIILLLFKSLSFSLSNLLLVITRILSFIISARISNFKTKKN